jgi:hypothetical protein
MPGRIFWISAEGMAVAERVALAVTRIAPSSPDSEAGAASAAGASATAGAAACAEAAHPIINAKSDVRTTMTHPFIAAAQRLHGGADRSQTMLWR